MCDRNQIISQSSKTKVKQRKKEPTLATGVAKQIDSVSNQQEGSEYIPVIVTEYKAPHSLRQAEMTTGLAKEIRPALDVIDGSLPQSQLQLFSSMVCIGVRYGSICTGEAFILVFFILDDPSSAQYSEYWSRLHSHKTCVLQYRSKRPRNLPPISMTLRSGRRPSEGIHRSMNSHSASPSARPSFTPSQSGIRGRTRRGGSGSAAKPRDAPGHGEVSGTQRMLNVIETPTIKTRPYCSQQCVSFLHSRMEALLIQRVPTTRITRRKASIVGTPQNPNRLYDSIIRADDDTIAQFELGNSKQLTGSSCQIS
ncbi:hypothetical protein PAAG_04924 [Paracoccidioides lutzii Pb01]|uniref:Uncharacterized protein n=1 Tax=Paracoccidioides lutzii (strain ATCC MYA-826 / Pb01) TaxID=502779 RepID=C1H1Y8_PARBA|nr:hypothetical protein PAAG_04924 [Paracoccidioides lutzii Pb01]EEH33875.1 hypothetical protein PAAG_04924 [Paracoccidioides lutzii Pb01]